MANWLRIHLRQVGLCLFALVCIAVGVVLEYTPTVASAGMSADRRAYWQWVGSINQGAGSALASGTVLLSENPGLKALYLRLADVCLEADAVETCRETFNRVRPPDSKTALYRRAALLRLDGLQPSDAVAEGWRQLARQPGLDPTLARLIVDLGKEEGQGGWLEDVEQGWRSRWEADSSAAGAAFGLGYLAVLRYEWDAAEALLTRATKLLPDDPGAYRELGRIYFFTSRPDRLEEVLEAGVEAARSQHDLEQELTLSGNLGWTLFLRNGDLAKAEKLIEEALDDSRTLGKGDTEGVNLYRLANLYLRQHRYDEALVRLDSAEVKYARYRAKRYAEVLALRGAVLSRLYRFSDAEAVLEEAIAEAESRDLREVKIQALVDLAALQYQMGRFATARETGLQALSLAQQNGLKDHEITAHTILGDVENRWGNFETAATHFETGFALAQQARNASRVREIALRLGLTALNLQDANTARSYFDAMVKSVQEDGQPVGLADAYLGLGTTYLQYRNTTEALRYYDLALDELAREDDTWLHAEIVYLKALAFLGADSLDAAAVLFEEARGMSPDNLSLAYRVAVGIGEVSLRQERYAEALARFQRAEAVGRRLPSPSMRWYVLFGEAMAHWRLHQPREAEAAFAEAVDLIETLRENLDSSANRASFVQDKVSVYEHFAAFLEEQGRSEEALFYTERARSRSLVDLLYTTQQAQKTDPSRSTNSLIEMERRVRALSRQIEDETPEEGERATAYEAVRTLQLRREYERADSMYRQAEVRITAEKPIYTFSPLPSASVRALLAAGEAMVFYDLRTLGEGSHEEAASVVYVVLPDTIIVRRLGVPASDIAEAVHFLRDQIGGSQGGPGEHWEPTARRLYQDLIAPVVSALPASVNHLHIVPEGVLYYLPFAALQDADGHFLVERYSLSFTPSGSILKLSRDRNPRHWLSMLLFGDPDGQLPGSREEVRAIASVGSGLHRRALVGAEATQENVLKYAAAYDVLHFATHSRFVGQAPWRSHLELHGDDVLSVEEIGQLDLDAYLVTLSACETALSGGSIADVPGGDEWIGLNQAFLAAGTPTVMASLWPIDDHVSSTFMIDFYKGLGEEGKSRALAGVQRQFIKNPQTKHPFYWAPFVITGDPL